MSVDSGVSVKAWKALFDKGIPFSSLLPYIAYDKKREVYVLSDTTGKGISLGSMLEFNLLPGELVDSKVESALTEAIEQLYTSGSFPEGTALQFIIYSSSSVEENIKKWEEGKQEGRDIFKEYTHFRKEKYQNLNFRNLRGFATVRQFYKRRPTEEEKDNFRTNIESLKATLDTTAFGQVKMDPRNVPPSELISIVTEILNDRKVKNMRYNDKHPIRKQIDYKYMHVYPNFSDISGKISRVCGISYPPDEPKLKNTVKILGDLYAERLQVIVPFLLTFNVTILDQFKKKADVGKRQSISQMQAGGALAKFFPKTMLLAQTLQGALTRAEMGKKFIRFSLHCTIFGSSDEESKRETQKALQLLSSAGFTPFEEGTIAHSVFLASLPLCWAPKLDKFLLRQKTIMSDRIASLTPLFGDWKGTPTPVMMFKSRRGEVLTFDFFDSEDNYNAVVAAASGSGKSFLVNDIIMSYLAEGGRAFVLDVGQSYAKLCEYLDGNFIEFSEDDPINVSPFIGCRYDESKNSMNKNDLAFVLPVICKMADIERKEQKGTLEEAIIEVFREHKQDTTMTHLYEHLKNSKDKETKRLSKMIFPYTRQGRFGTFFHEGKKLHFENPLTVFELEGLKAKKELQSVVLLMIIFHINRKMEMLDKGIKKLLVIDEAWKLLSDEYSAEFIENAYRVYRKYGASAISITQSLNDLYKNPAGIAITENAAFYLLLKQKAETLQSLYKSKRLMLSEENFELLRTIKTVNGKYSEIFFYTPLGCGIGRFMPDPFSYWLYTTDPKDAKKLKDIIKEKSLSKIEALKVLALERR